MNLLFLVFEILVGLLFALCIRHTWRRGPHVLWRLIVGVVFGLLLEWGTILQLDAYTYGPFTLMLGPVPVVIGVAWGVITYSCQLFSNQTSLPLWVRPILDGLLALSIDLAMDAIAIRLGMWDWGPQQLANYFGVPYANFWAWFWVVSSFSAGTRLLAQGSGWLSRWMGPLAALVAALAAVFGTNMLILILARQGLYLPSIGLVLGVALLLMLALRPVYRPSPDGRLSLAVGLSLHLYFLAAGVVSGVIVHPPVLFLVSLAMLALTLTIHRRDIALLLQRQLPVSAAT